MGVNVFDRQALPGFATLAVLLCLPLAAGGALAPGLSGPERAARLDDRLRPGRRQRHHVPHPDRDPRQARASTRATSSPRTARAAAAPWAGAISTTRPATRMPSPRTSGSYITTPLQADTPWEPTAFTPIALLATDDLVLLVNGNSDIDSFEAFIERAKADPPTIGGIGAVNVDFIVPTLLAEKAGFEFDYVSFNAEGELNDGAALGRARCDRLEPRRGAGADRVRRHEGARLQRPGDAGIARRHPDLRRGRLRGEHLDAARPDPRPRRARGSSAMVDRDHEEGGRDARVAASTSRATT